MLLRFDTIARTPDFDERASTMHLRPWQWRFLLAADGRTPLDDLAVASGIAFETAAELVAETEALGLVDIVTQTLEQYRAEHARGAGVIAPLVPPLVAEIPMVPVASNVTAISFGQPVSDIPPISAQPESPQAESPLKKVSLSFDSFSSMFDEVSVLAPEASATESTPVATEPVKHDAPHAVSEENATQTVESPADFSADPAKKSVSYSLFAPTFGSAALPLDHEESHAVLSETNGHVESEPISNGRARVLSFDIGAAPMLDGEYEPPGAMPISFEPEPCFEHEQTLEPVHESPAPAHDDVLLQHFQVPTNGVHPSDASGSPNEGEPKGDLTGNLLRALGLIK